MKPIPKTMRESNRYISFKIESDTLHSYDAFAKSITDMAIHLVGVLGASHAQLQLIKDQYAFPNGVLKASKNGAIIARSILSCISMVNGLPVRVETLRTSGEIGNVRIAPKPQRFKNHKSIQLKTKNKK